MKYRRLTDEELKEMEQEFINFLVSNTITGEDWEKLKLNNPEKAQKLIENFSDIVLQKVLEKIEFIEHRTAKDWKIFQCQPDKILMKGFSADANSHIDFNSPNVLKDIEGSTIQLYKAEKAYNSDREKEIFEMIQSGCTITEGKVFNVMAHLHSK